MNWKVALLLFLYAAAASGQPLVTFTASDAVATNVTSGGSVAWLAVAHASRGYLPRLVTRSGMTIDDDRDGTVRFGEQLVIRPDSVWVVVDLATGDAVIASPDPAYVAELRLTPSMVVARSDVDRAAFDGEYMTLFYVRPGVGAWSVTLDDGDPQEPDAAADRRVVAPLTRLVPIESDASPPNHVRAGDVLAVINQDTLAAGMLQIGR